MSALAYWLRRNRDGQLTFQQFINSESLRRAAMRDGFTIPMADASTGSREIDGYKYEWGTRAVDPSRCPNPWHRSGLARGTMPCPECPPTIDPNPAKPKVEYRVWACYPGFEVDRWIPVSVPFETHESADQWARCLNVEYRVEEEED